MLILLTTYLYVALVDKAPCGAYYRKGLAMVAEKSWMKVRNSKWEPIFLA